MAIELLGIGLFILFILMVITVGVAGLGEGYTKQKRRNDRWK